MKGFQIQQKGERRISAALRIMLVVVLLAVQIGFVVAISYFMQEYLALAYGVVQVGALFLAVHIYNEPGELSYKLIWFILLLLAPPVGMILWFLWGGAAQKRHLPQNTKRFPDEPESVRMRSEIAVDKLTRQLPAWSRTANYLCRRDFQLYQNTSVTYLPEGAILLRNLIDRAAKAERFIFLEYFILAEGKLWDELEKILCAKAREGVEVKIIFDDFGNIKRFSGETIDRLREVGGEGAHPTLSIGVGKDGETYRELFQFANLSIDMALSRGGDQAVIKDRMNFTFFGGRSVEAEYSSKVRSRVTAGSLMELIGQSSQVFVMGHSNADLDSLGAAMGICCLCRKKGKPANIVIDLEHNSTTKLISQVLKVPEYEGVFISGQEAMVACDKGSVLVVVDTNRPDQVEFKPLLEAINKVCVVDHHRRAADYISPVVLDLHETYASSASELVTELLIYGVDSSDVLPIEAKALLAGICMDTKFFNVRTGERTFEAAAALRRMGADTTEVKLLMQNDFQGTVAKYQIVRSARLYRGELAIAALNYETNRILAAQAADDMLNISGITASFVLFPDNGQTIISARSIGKVNVQVILEELGGGGNAMVAGAQMKDTPVDQALDRLVEAIDKFYEG